MSVMTAIFKKYRIAAISAIAMLLIELAVELVQPLIISRIIDHGIRQHEVSVAWIWGGVLMASALVAFIAGIASSFFCLACKPRLRLRPARQAVREGAVFFVRSV